MEEDHKAVIQNNFGKLLEDLDPKAIMRYLFEKKVITSENVDTIKSKKSRLSKGDELLHILMRSGPDAFPKFIAGLRETKKPWLALLLLEEEKERLSEKAKQSKELSEEKSEKWSEEKKHLEERIMELETGQSNGDDLKQQMETLTNAFGNCNDLKIQIETLEKEKQDIVERCTNSEEQLKFNEGQWSMREKDYEDQIEELKNQLKHYEDDKKNHSPSPGHGKSTSASGSRESIFRGGVSVLDREDFEEQPEISPSVHSIRGLESTEGMLGCQTNRVSQTKVQEYFFSYTKDFDREGVIYYLGELAGVNEWKNPARVSTSGVKVTFCEGDQGNGTAPENILEYFDLSRSHTVSGWCLDLGKKYTLRLTDYTLRQIGSNDKTFLSNFELYGSLYNKDDWYLLSKQNKVDWRSQRFSHVKSRHKDVPYKTKTWNIKGELKACRYFKIVKMKGASLLGTKRVSLGGIELYGVLSVLDFSEKNL